MSLDNDVVVIREMVDESHDRPLTTKELWYKTLRILIPTDVSSLLWMSSQTITLAYVGRYLHKEGTAQYSASIIIFNMCAFSFVQGFGAAIDTLSSQAFGANPKSPEVGETLQMALALNCALGLLFSFFFLYSRPLVCAVFEKEVCMGVVQFLRYSPPYLFAQIISGVMSKTMYAQKLPEVVAAANGVAALTSPLANYFLTPYGIHGASLALAVTVGLCSMTHIICAIFHPKAIIRYAPWPSPKLWDLGAWKTFFHVGVPALVATCAEWWAFEIQTVIASRISVTALAVHGVAMNLVSLLFSVALGVCVAASVIVGNSLGAGRPRQAKQFARFIILCDVGLGLITAFFMFLFGSHIAHLFAEDAEVIRGVVNIIPLVALAHAGDSLQFCLQGIFRGVNRPTQGGLAVLLTLWCVGVPASAFFVFVLHTGVYGCLGGIVVGMAIEIPLLGWWMRQFDWQQLADRASRSQNKAAGATDVVLMRSSVDDPCATSSHTHSRTSSVYSQHCLHDTDNASSEAPYERELHERTVSILEEACCSLHGSFAMPPLNKVDGH
ncbi:putative membrane transporter protein [Leptomonas seymouri]|uniref:Putative membrane transporter protein n=1 Tax=Leptomonas seymouri TaxID=5684 RepID=A0A0N0P381_LEPSE|nr:putative membrane transporter protein [Leptomonas seymouri]|eukprot:KPI83826.1 putative membrane transporter protein [Leptomonas seymouri]